MNIVGKSQRQRVAIENLRARIRALEHGDAGSASFQPPGTSEPVVPLGAAALDSHLPGGGLGLAGLHEIAGARDEWDDGAAAGFCVALAGRLTAAPAGAGRPLLWVARRPDLYGPGVAALGLDPGRLILAHASGDAETLWAMEEGLRSRAPAAVVGEVAEPDGIATRRLQLAAESAGRPCFLLRRRLHAARGPGATTAALTRWRVAALPSGQTRPRVNPGENPQEKQAQERLAGLPGRPRWRVELLRCHGAAPQTFSVEWDDAAGDFALVAGLRDPALAPPAAAGAAG